MSQATECSRGGFDALAAKSDTVNLAKIARALYATSGDVKVLTVDGSTLVFAGWPGGILPVQVLRLFSTGTTSTTVLGLY